MKELTIEEKAQRYDEVIEGIQEILSSGQDSIKMSRLQLRLQGIIPELKSENEDEKIRKELIEIVEEIRSTTYYGRCCYKEIPFKSILAWLEKQGEHDPEYVRKDAFIEKAIGWIDYNNRNGGCNFDRWEKDFKKYMEGE